MLARETYFRLFGLYLAIGLISFALLMLEAVFMLLPDLPFRIHFSLFWHSVYIAWFFIGHLLYLKNLAESKELFNVEELFSYIAGYGLVALLITSLPEIYHTFGLEWELSPVSSAIFNLLSDYLYVFYFIVGLVLFRKLVYVKKNGTTILLWNLFFNLLIASVIFNFTSIEIPSFIASLFLVFSGIVGVLLMMQLRWIALLRYKNKLISIAFLVVINLISLRFAFKLLFSIDDSPLFHHELLRNVFLILVSGFVNLYGIFSLLALLFNLPISSVMEQKESEMSSFQELNKIIQDKFHVKDILDVMFTACFQNTLSEGGWLSMMKDDEEQVIREISMNADEITEISRSMKTFNLLQVEKGMKYFYNGNLQKDEDFYNVETDYNSLLVYPVLSHRKVMGKMYLLKSYRNGFDEYMINLVKTYADQAKLAFENSQLVKEALEAERLKQELRIAQKVQQSLLPHSFPENLFFEISAMSESAREVGGDYYDFYTLDKNNYAVVIGDVSGKGTSAVFHMAEMKGIFQTLIPHGLNPMDFLIQVNTAVSRCFEKNLFITLSYFLIRCYQHKITFSRAGHCPLLYYTANEKKAEYIKEGGIGLGIIRNETFAGYVQVSEIRFHANDVMVLYTDGLIEARNQKDNQEYGYERLLRQVEASAHLGAAEIRHQIINDLKSFIQDSPPIDDLTLLVIKFK